MTKTMEKNEIIKLLKWALRKSEELTQAPITVIGRNTFLDCLDEAAESIIKEDFREPETELEEWKYGVQPQL